MAIIKEYAMAYDTAARAGNEDDPQISGESKASIMRFPRRWISAGMGFAVHLFFLTAICMVRLYFSSLWMRRCYRATNYVSLKTIYVIFPWLHLWIFVDLKSYLKSHYLRYHYDSLGNASRDIRTLAESHGVDYAALCRSSTIVASEFNPKISVIVPNYNHAKYLRERLDSIYAQSYRNFEVILLDDASSDESRQILEEYQRRYPDITRCCFNEVNSGGVFHQWRRGIELARGDLIWLAESDDYCSENLLAELAKPFANEAVMLAYCRTVFVEGEDSKQVWSIEEFLMDLNLDLWRDAFVKSAHYLVGHAWAIKNILPNVSSAVFRHPGKMELFENDQWRRMKFCGDWVFYLHLIRGGLVAYTPQATNYFRQHKNNTSVSIQNKDVYYREHEAVAKETLSLYEVGEEAFDRQRQMLESHWRLFREGFCTEEFERCYDVARIRQSAERRKPNILLVAYALTAGGGETFPIKLANMLKAAGYGITFLNCREQPTEEGVRRMLRGDIPLLELDSLQSVSALADDMNLEIIHSHHAWVDVTLCVLLECNPNCKLIITTHGMYEMIPAGELPQVLHLLKKRVSKIVYTADKNLKSFNFNHFDKSHFVKIDNALDIVPINPVSRKDLNVPENAFLICMVTRAIPDKGWQEAIQAVAAAREISGKDIHLLLIGEGPEYDRLKPLVKEKYIHFLGFRSNIRDYFAASDLGFLPTRFPGESFPLVMIDCFHSNRPMLASNIGEISRMISTPGGPAGTVFELDDFTIPIGQVAEIIASYARDKSLYAEHLNRVSAAAAKFDAKALLKNYESVYLPLHREKAAA
jgi:glycosyltransferase involved in cell wall biosynthesis